MDSILDLRVSRDGYSLECVFVGGEKVRYETPHHLHVWSRLDNGSITNATKKRLLSEFELREYGSVEPIDVYEQKSECAYDIDRVCELLLERVGLIGDGGASKI